MLYPEKLSILNRTFSLVKDYAEEYPVELQAEKPDAKAFSATEIVYHLLEVEELWQRRIHQLLHEDRPEFIRIDPDALAKDHHYNERDHFEGIMEWQHSRNDTLELINSLSEEDMLRKGIHSSFGELDVYRILDIMADHDLQHLSQMKRTFSQVSG